jgi:hypothetical protein
MGKRFRGDITAALLPQPVVADCGRRGQRLVDVALRKNLARPVRVMGP